MRGNGVDEKTQIEMIQKVEALVQFKGTTEKRLDNMEVEMKKVGDIKVMLEGMSKDITYIQKRAEETDKKSDINNTEIKGLINDLSASLDILENAPNNNLMRKVTDNKRIIFTACISILGTVLAGMIIRFISGM
ncbi:MAG: hypothetical protein K0S30_1248 [Clostridia bacterium]|jgi:CHASE3 domain sensor protein|nr:hypothetical protein [Clostridia bacterium]